MLSMGVGPRGLRSQAQAWGCPFGWVARRKPCVEAGGHRTCVLGRPLTDRCGGCQWSWALRGSCRCPDEMNARTF